jgi:flagellar basal-body rod protein FlgG
VKALYTAATGMSAQQTQLDNIANNLANVNTTGYKRSSVAFQDLYYQEVTGGGVQGDAQGVVQVGSGTKVVGNYRNHSMGDLVNTGVSSDVAIKGKGFFKVIDETGQEFYTRDGSFQRNAEGALITVGGLLVQGVSAISPDAESFSVGSSGEVTEYLSDGSEQSLGMLEVMDFVNPAGLNAIGGNLYRETQSSGAAQFVQMGNGSTQLSQYMRESSNVDVAVELIEMIQAQRSFELTSKVIQASDEALQTTANLKR